MCASATAARVAKTGATSSADLLEAVAAGGVQAEPGLAVADRWQGTDQHAVHVGVAEARRERRPAQVVADVIHPQDFVFGLDSEGGAFTAPVLGLITTVRDAARGRQRFQAGRAGQDGHAGMLGSGHELHRQLHDPPQLLRRGHLLAQSRRQVATGHQQQTLQRRGLGGGRSRLRASAKLLLHARQQLTQFSHISLAQRSRVQRREPGFYVGQTRDQIDRARLHLHRVKSPRRAQLCLIFPLSSGTGTTLSAHMHATMRMRFALSRLRSVRPKRRLLTIG